MSRLSIILLLAVLTSSHDILQLTSEETPVLVTSQVDVEMREDASGKEWEEFTVGGWFSSACDSTLTLMTLTSADQSLKLTQSPNGQFQVVVGKRSEQSLALTITAIESSWHYISVSQSASRDTFTLCVMPWQGKMDCISEEKPVWLTPFPAQSAKTVLGSNTSKFILELLDVNIVSVALLPSEAESMAETVECCDFKTSFWPATTSLQSSYSPNGLKAKDKYNQADLWENFEWEFGINMFLWDTYDFGVNFSTVKVVIELNDVMGDPDMEVYLYSMFSSDYFLGKADKEGPDRLVYDWNHELFANGMDALTVFRVWINGKSWFNWYTVTFYYYSTSLFRESSGKAITAMHQVKATQYSGWGWAVLILSLLVLITGIYLYKRTKKIQKSEDDQLLERLLGPSRLEKLDNSSR